MAEPFANNISQKHIFHLESIQNIVMGLNQVSHGSRDFFSTFHSQNPSSLSILFDCYSIYLCISNSWSTLVFSLLFGIPLVNESAAQIYTNRIFAVVARIKDNQIVWVEWKFGTLYEWLPLLFLLWLYRASFYFSSRSSSLFTKYMSNMYTLRFF